MEVQPIWISAAIAASPDRGIPRPDSSINSLILTGFRFPVNFLVRLDLPRFFKQPGKHRDPLPPERSRIASSQDFPGGWRVAGVPSGRTPLPLPQWNCPVSSYWLFCAVVRPDCSRRRIATG